MPGLVNQYRCVSFSSYRESLQPEVRLLFPRTIPDPRIIALCEFCTFFASRQCSLASSQSLHASKPGMIGPPEGKSLVVAVPCIDYFQIQISTFYSAEEFPYVC